MEPVIQTSQPPLNGPPRRPHMKRWILIGSIFLILLVVLLVLFRILSQKKQTTGNQPAPISQVHTDSGNYYTITIPSNWKAKEDLATGTTGLNTAKPTNQNIEVSQLYGSDQVGIVIQVYEGRPDCTSVKKPNTRLAGLPAHYDDARYLWEIPTTDALYVVSYSYPGLRLPHGPMESEQPTPIPQSTMTANQKLIDTILKKLKLTHSQPLSCLSS